MKKYDLFVLLPNLTDEEVKSISQQTEEIIKKVGGQIEKTEDFGKRKLSYVVKKIRHGFYLNYLLELEVVQIKQLSRELKLNPNVLRFELSTHRPIPMSAQQAKSRRLVNKKTEDKKISRPELKEEKNSEKKKVSLEELDERLNNILNNENNI